MKSNHALAIAAMLLAEEAADGDGGVEGETRRNLKGGKHHGGGMAGGKNMNGKGGGNYAGEPAAPFVLDVLEPICDICWSGIPSEDPCTEANGIIVHNACPKSDGVIIFQNTQMSKPREATDEMCIVKTDIGSGARIAVAPAGTSLSSDDITLFEANYTSCTGPFCDTGSIPWYISTLKGFNHGVYVDYWNKDTNEKERVTSFSRVSACGPERGGKFPCGNTPPRQPDQACPASCSDAPGSVRPCSCAGCSDDCCGLVGGYDCNPPNHMKDKSMNITFCPGCDACWSGIPSKETCTEANGIRVYNNCPGSDVIIFQNTQMSKPREATDEMCIVKTDLGSGARIAVALAGTGTSSDDITLFEANYNSCVGPFCNTGSISWDISTLSGFNHAVKVEAWNKDTDKELVVTSTGNCGPERGGIFPCGNSPSRSTSQACPASCDDIKWRCDCVGCSAQCCDAIDGYDCNPPDHMKDKPMTITFCPTL